MNGAQALTQHAPPQQPRPLTAYGLRPVKASELAKVCGGAFRALKITGGDSRLALYYLANPGRAATAPKVPRHKTELAEKLAALAGPELARERAELRDARKQARAEAKHAERIALAGPAWDRHQSIAAVMRSARCRRQVARQLIAEIQATGRAPE